MGTEEMLQDPGQDSLNTRYRTLRERYSLRIKNRGADRKRKLKLSGSNPYPKNSFFDILLYLSPCNHKEDPEEFPSVHPISYQSVLPVQD